MITANIHGVKSIRFACDVHDNFVSHRVIFETEDGPVEISGFAEKMLEVEVTKARDCTTKGAEVAA